MADDAIDVLAPIEVAQLLRSGRILLVDVREPKEYEEQRIAGALLFPLSTFDNAALPRGDLPQIVFQCGSGKRSLLAAQMRLQSGASRVAHMAGGLAAWVAAGLPVLSASR
jgi:rhodanese-related sulfurtransferase